MFDLMLRAAAGAVAIALLLYGTSASGRDDGGAPPERLVVAIPSHFPPQYIVRGDGIPTGFAIEVIEAIAKRAGIRLEYLPKESWPKTLDALRNGEADLIPNIGITPDRARDFAFTRPMETFKVSIFVRDDTPDVARVEDLASRKVAVVRANVAQHLLGDRPELGLQTVEYDHLSEAMLALLSGWVDALAYPEPTVRQTAREAGLDSRLKVIGQPLIEIKRAIAVRKDRQALLHRLDQGLGDLVKDPEFRAIYTKWYGQSDPWWKDHRILLSLGVLLLALVIAVLLRYWVTLRNNRQLQRELEMNARISKAVRESEERYRGVVESLAEGVVIQTHDDQIVTANRSASDLLGVNAEYLTGAPLTDPRWHFLREEGSDLPPAEHPIRKTLDSGRPQYGMVLGLADPSQGQRWLSVNTQPLIKEGEANPYAVVASFQDITKLKTSVEALNRKNQLLDALGRVQAKFIFQKEESAAFDLMLERLLALTGSEYGFIGKVLTDAGGSRYLKTYAITNIAWNAETRALYDSQASQGMEFRDLGNLFGLVLTKGEPVVSNDPANDPRSGGLPPGHPALNSFAGLPMHLGDRLVGMAGIANRKDGYDQALIEELQPFLQTGANLIEALEDRRSRTRAQLALQDSESRLRSVLDNAVDSIITIDSSGAIQSFNRASEAIFGYRAQEVIGESVSLLMPGPQGKTHPGYLAAYLSAGAARALAVPREVTGRRKDGSLFPIEITVGEVEIQGERLFTGILREVTERKQMEAELVRHRDHLETLVQERNLDLKAANEEIKQFAYIVSHDLRAPLVNIKGFTRELQASLQELYGLMAPLVSQLQEGQREDYLRITRDELPEAMEFVESSASKMDRQINAILKLSRTGRREFAPVELVTDELVKRVLDTMAHQAETAQVQIEVAGLPNIVADPTALEQIFSNLLDNAIKYLRPGVPGLIEIRADRDRRETTFHVCDNGRGIAERDLGKIFSIFQRVGVQDQPGDGMGLTYVQALLRRMGGRIWCDSRPTEGSCFHFTVPQQR